MQSVDGEIATIQWLDSGVPGDNGIEQININLLRYVSLQPKTNINSQNSLNTDHSTEYDSDEPTANSIASLNFGGLIAATTISNTDTNTEESNSVQGNENHTTTEMNNAEVIEDTASDFFDEQDDQTWMDAIKVEVEKLCGFKVTHHGVDLTVTHYGTDVGSIHHNQDDELEIEQKLIGELAKYNFDLEAFLVESNIPYKLYKLKPVIVTNTQTSEVEKKSPTGSESGKLPDSRELNDNESNALDIPHIKSDLMSESKTLNAPVDLFDKLAKAFEGFDIIRTERMNSTLWFYRGEHTLNPCYLKHNENSSTLIPSFRLTDKMKELFGIDLEQVCADIEAGLSVDIYNYIDHSVWEQTKNQPTDTCSIKIELKPPIGVTSTTTPTLDQVVAPDEKHPKGLHWTKDTSMFNRTCTYIVWDGAQQCGKIHQYKAKNRNKSKYQERARDGKWYTSFCSNNYYDTIEDAATAYWENFISRNAEQTATEEELIPF